MSRNNERLEALFEAAVALENDAQRARYLDRACPDPALRREVESLLAGHQQPDSLFGPTTIRVEPVADEAVGTVLGRYKLLEALGEGGCGIVYVAEQTEPVRRRVALKVIKLGMDTKQVVARFEAERQALAMMDHPNVAKVLDAGTTEQGRPYFVMELVRGIRITDYCDQNRLASPQRLELFVKVCQAIQHAHQKGIIHRDIKPSNILVTLHDGVPVPKVIDFGIAKATEGRLTDATVYTQLHQFIGTPAYMSPEQAEMSGLDIDTRSDIYSLGVLLYELLVGCTPFDGQDLVSSGIDAMRRTIREQEPVRPSNRIATLQGEALTATAKRRSSEPSRLRHQLKGDLDWIVMKCLEKDRARRYDTANALAGDIARHLGNEPVLARAPGALYRLRKLVRRHRAAAFSVLGIGTASMVGLGFGLFALVRERTQAGRTDAVTAFVYHSLSETVPTLIQQGNRRAARDLIDTTERHVGSSLSNAPVSELVVRLQLWRFLIEQIKDYPAALRQGEAIIGLVPKIGVISRLRISHDLIAIGDGITRLWASGDDLAAQDKALTDLGELYTGFMARKPQERQLAGESRAAVAGWMIARGRIEEAETLLAQALEILPPDKDNSRHSRSVPDYAEVLIAQGKADRAEAVLRDNLSLSPPPDAESRGLHLEMVAQLGSALCALGRSDDAEALFAERRRWSAHHGGTGAQLALADASLASVPARSGKAPAAAALFEALSTNAFSRVRDWHAATVLASVVGDRDAHRRLRDTGLARFASIAEEQDAYLLADGLMRQPMDDTTSSIVRVLVARVGESQTRSKELAGLVRARLAAAGGRHADALAELDPYLATARSGGIRTAAAEGPARLAGPRFFRARLCAEAGRTEEAAGSFAAALESSRPTGTAGKSGDRGPGWLKTYETELDRRAAEAAFKAHGIPLPAAATPR